MEEVSPYSVDVVFLAQLVIITIYSPCSAVNTTIRNATIRDVQADTYKHTHRQVYTYSTHKIYMHINIHVNSNEQATATSCL